MVFSYNKLWKLLIDKNMMKTELQEAVGMSASTLAKMGKNEPISMNTVGRICKVLKCDISDVVEYIDDES
jgi:DNA-binding Xre family transcriptional regulator